MASGKKNKFSIGDLSITPHPVLPAPDEEMIEAVLKQPNGEELLASYIIDREETIRRENEDPFNFGYEPDNWRDADDLLAEYDELLINGGNRAGKSCYAAKRVVQMAVRVPNARIWCLHTTSMSSVQMQHPLIHQYLPLEWKNAKKGRVSGRRVAPSRARHAALRWSEPVRSRRSTAPVLQPDQASRGPDRLLGRKGLAAAGGGKGGR